jgi:Tol biopolymer transport system component
MREDGGRLVLMDFGAGHETEGRMPGDPLGKDMTGTPLYLAPELYAGGRADRRTDTYALGVLLFYLVTRRFPVTGRSLTELGEAHGRGTRTRLRDLRADLPGALVRAVEKAIAADPAERFQTAGALEAALEGTASPFERPAVSYRAIGLSAALGLIVIALTAGVVGRLSGGGGGDPNGRLNRAPALLTSVTMRRLVPPKGVDLLSNPSDDGRFIVGEASGTGDAAIVDFATGEYRALGVGRLDKNPEDGTASAAALSPDGTAIAVNWSYGDRGVLRLVRSDGTGLRTLVEPAGEAIPYQWTRDGSMILVSLVDPQGVNTIALVAAVDGAVRPLRRLAGWINESPEHMTLSPDGRYVAYDYPEGPAAIDRDIFVLDTHTGDQWPLAVSPGHDTSPVWTPDGRAVVFFSDRTRTLSAWAVAMANGHPQGPPQLVKDDVGRIWARGFTRDGALHLGVTTGFGELDLSTLDQGSPGLQRLFPRLAASNLYPRWSPDGRWLAYASERGVGVRRELWIYDTESRTESRVPVTEKIGTAAAWSPDSTQLLVRGANNDLLYIVDRVTGQSRLVARDVYGAKWLPEGVVIQRSSDGSVVLLDASTGAVLRTVPFPNSVRSVFPMAIDGRTALAAFTNGRVRLQELRNGATREWLDSGVTFMRGHVMAPHTAAVAYLADRKDLMGQARTLMVWSGAGAPRELLRVRDPDWIVLHGWTADGLSLFVTRWSGAVDAAGNSPTRTLWRLPITGGTPVSTGLSMEGLRDLSIHPDGRQIAFNARFKRSESWVMENLISSP